MDEKFLRLKKIAVPGLVPAHKNPSDLKSLALKPLGHTDVNDLTLSS